MLPTNNIGNPDPSNSSDEDEDSVKLAEQEERPVPLKLLVLAVGILIFACVIGVQVAGVIYPIVFPPVPPLPEGVVEVSHVSSDYGVDEWLYTTTEPACQVVQFYVNEGAQCRFVPDCDPSPVSEIPPDAQNITQNVTRCVAEEQVSIFAMRWQVVVAINPDFLTEFRLQREVFWTGVVPPLQQPEPVLP